MNIQEAKEQIKNAVRVYLKKDQFGNYRIPLQRQRPIFLLGPPGIGKTAIMEQIASELNIALVSYSMTHHTRQSALGLPFIEHKTFANREYKISEYTMSEIISTVYDTIEESGVKEGILFLDEINCVSETLAPAILQFLQYKVFGRHKVPEGWVIVTAGNPPEYNKSVRELDIATMDRLKILEVKEDYEVWRKYASFKGIHGAILSYLDIKPEDFYLIEASLGEKYYVTARGWEDLSETIILYEEEEISVDITLVSQYIRNKRVARDFSIYYELYNKYKQVYKVDDVLSGNTSNDAKKKARGANFEERLSILGLLLDALQKEIRLNSKKESYLFELVKILRDVKIKSEKETSMVNVLQESIDNILTELERERKASSLSEEKYFIYQSILKYLEDYKEEFLENNLHDPVIAYKRIKESFEKEVKALQEEIESIKKKLHHLFSFVEDVFGERELFILLSELTNNYYSAKFISSKGSDDYYRHNKKLLFNKRQESIATRLEELDRQ